MPSENPFHSLFWAGFILQMLFILIMGKLLNKIIARLVVLISISLPILSCSTKRHPTLSSEHKTSIDDALIVFKSKQSFWSQVRKTKFYNNQIYSLVLMKGSPQAMIQSHIVIHSLNGDELSVQSPPLGFTAIDFDITPDGHVVQLAFEEIQKSDHGFPLKQLSILIDSKQAFSFHDSKQNSALRYDRNGKPSPARHYDVNQTYFLTTSPLTQFARLRVTDREIFISAVGTFGFKLFAFDFAGRERTQIELLPFTEFNTFHVDKSAALFDLLGSQVIVAASEPQQNAHIFEKHFGVPLKWEGPEWQVVLQTLNLSNSSRRARTLGGSINFNASGIEVSQDKLAVFGSAGGPGNRKGLIAVLKPDLTELYQSEISLAQETDLSAATFQNESVVVGGGTGGLQVETGSVVTPNDAFIGVLSSKGTFSLISRFGTNRNDVITSLISVNDNIFASGNRDGPITHTADSDLRQGYQGWFLGKLRTKGN